MKILITVGTIVEHMYFTIVIHTKNVYKKLNTYINFSYKFILNDIIKITQRSLK